MRRTLIVVSVSVAIACLAIAAPARAQSGAESTTGPPGADRSLRIPTLVWTGAATADWVTTYRFSSGYAGILHERNPLIGGLEGHPAWMIAAGAALDGATVWAGYRLVGRGHPRLMRIALYAGAAYRCYLAIDNMRMMQQARAIKAGAAAAGSR